MRIGIVATVICFSIGGLATAQNASAEIRESTHIVAQGLGTALKELAQTRGLQVLYISSAVRNVRTRGAAGDMTANEAFDQLLAGTGLTYRYLDENTVTIVPTSAPASGGDAAQAPGLPSKEGKPDSSQDFRVAQVDQRASTSPSTVEQAAPSAQQSSSLEEIIVTARRREENVQSVPIAVTVLSPQTLQDNNVSRLQDIESLVPSLTVSTGNVGSKDTANVDIRGQGWASLTGAPAVVMYLNESSIVTTRDGMLAGGPGLFFDLENVQILKGPQGTLFGRNTMGGAVLLQSARPDSEFGGHLQAGLGNYDDREMDGAINLPIVSDVLLTRIAVNAQIRDGYTHVISEPDHPNGYDLDNRDTFSVRGTVTLRPNDSIQNDAILTYQKYTSHGPSDVLVGAQPSQLGALAANYPNLLTYLAEQQALGPYTHLPIGLDESQAGGDLLAFQNITRVSLGENLTFRNIIGVQSAHITQSADVDGTPYSLFDVPIYQDPVHQETEEAQFLGSAFGAKLNWQAGFYYLTEHSPDNSLTNVVFLSNPSPQRQGYNTDSKAIYGQGTYDLSAILNGLKTTLGIRDTWDRVDTINLSADPSNPAPSNCGYPDQNCSFVNEKGNKSSAITWTAGLEYQATEQSLIYLESRRGYRRGGDDYVPFVQGATLIYPYGPEYVTDFELGTKSDWKLGTVPIRTNLDVYDQEYTDIQVNEQVPYPGAIGGTIGIVGNAAAARQWGVEFEGMMKLTPNLAVGANYDYLHFEYVKFGQGVDGAGLIAGETANRVPIKYGANVRYDVPLKGMGDIAFNATYSWQDHFGNFLGTSQIPSHDLLNLAVDWKSVSGGPLDLSFFMSNALNKAYQTGGIDIGHGWTEATYGDPRMYGIRLNYRFGAMAK